MKIHFISLGCDKNLTDSEVMIGTLAESGFSMTDEAEKADAIVINTCGFIADAVSENVETILDAARYKTEGACKALVVTGCLAQRYKDEIFKEMPEVDAIIGPGSLNAVADAVNGVLLKSQKINLTDFNGAYGEDFYEKRVLSAPFHYAYIKIAEGCDNKCVYCAIPSIRGRYRSRPFASVMAEARRLAAGGVKEIILVAQDTSLYGEDLGKNMLAELLASISEIDGVEWIRIMYAYPERMTNDVIEEIARNKKVCKYIDVPAQHSDEGVLRRMGRKGGVQAAIERLREGIPGVALRTTLIVGFPGETEEEFQSLLMFVRKTRFDRLGVFEFSREPGTPAYDMKNQVSSRVKRRRKDELMRLQRDISMEISRGKIGKRVMAIVDGKTQDGRFQCRTQADAPDVDGTILFKHDGEMLSGSFVELQIIEASEYDLTGALINEYAK
ncbi:MAG: 30S ribosomal protein S12 methylthiotransferase RimO [Clostridiales bacterium]|jgi:ribosomal protein S12 methylthiotransferase|nr:30S ribosomal protein S12 methylthiotransferase RimO [Clostridiales bacterium]